MIHVVRVRYKGWGGLPPMMAWHFGAENRHSYRLHRGK